MVRRRLDEPNMSDNLLLVKVEDLINMAMGPAEKNIVNYKLVQLVLHILARNLRMLETQVEIRINDEDELKEKQRQEAPLDDGAGSTRGRVQMKGIKEREEHGQKKAKEHKAKAERTASKDREKEVRAALKEREKAVNQHEIEEKHAAKEKERVEKYFTVEKGPTTRADSHTRVGSIEVVTLSQFELLETAVNNLKTMTGSFPSPDFPDNKKLMEDIANGTASLTDIMQAMQVTARIKAAEQAISRMADLLTQLAAAGAIPEELVELIEEVKAEVDEVAAAAAEADAKTAVEEGEERKLPVRSRPSTDHKSTGVDTMSNRIPKTRPAAGVHGTTHGPTGSSVSKMAAMPPVSHKEMDDALHALKEDLNNMMSLMTGKATTSAETAFYTAKGVAEKLDVAVKLNTRISTLYSLVNDYAEQLNGFDTGLTSQMQGFNDQMEEMRTELKAGLEQLNQAGGNSETTAVMELRERYDLLVSELDATVHEHQGLSMLQKKLADELKNLMECVEMLREQKADHDEVQDGLRDKADISRLVGLLTEEVFASVRGELERRLELCHEKFSKQEQVWMVALKDLTRILETKAELLQLAAARDDVQGQLRDLHHKLHALADILGEPKAAMLTRQLSRDATCGACMEPALMAPWDTNYGSPPPLPALRPPPTGAEDKPEDPCLRDFEPPQPLDAKVHICHRWVGGSHTVISEMVTKERARPMDLQGSLTKRYTGYGSDGRLYMLEEDLQPCVECNVILEAARDEKRTNVSKDGGGDQGDIRMSETEKQDA